MTKLGVCDNCQEEGKVLRCTKCKKVQYCSRACQKNHWKLLHRYTCSPIDGSSKKDSVKCKTMQTISTQEDTAKELMMSIHQMSIQEVHTKYLSLQEEIEELKKKEKERNLEYQAFARQALMIQKRNKKNETKNIKMDEQSSNLTKTQNKQYFTTNTQEKPFSMENKFNSDTSNKKPHLSSKNYISSEWLYTIEYLKNISCFLILLKPPTKNNKQKNIIPQRDELKINFEHTKDCKQNAPSYNTRIHITFQPKQESNQFNLLNILLPGNIHENDTTLTIHSDSIYLRIKYSSDNQTLYPNETNNIFNINNSNNFFTLSSSYSLPDHLNSLMCRSCHFYLLQNNVPPVVKNNKQGIMSDNQLPTVNMTTKIKKIYPLPTGYWDEISDYLVCTDDEPKIPFSKSSCTAIPNQALQDGNVLVLHKSDLDNRISILSNVNGYGENSMNSSNDPIDDIKKEDSHAKNDSDTANFNPNQTNQYKEKEMNDVYQDSVIYRGDRIWKDVVGGETVCCSQCYSILGFSLFNDPDSIRILKHRVSTDSIYADDNFTHDNKDLHLQKPISLKSSRGFFQNNTCGSFIAQEMIRYAESQAVYKFVVIASKNDSTENGSMKHDMKCMVLHLLSWDTKLATNHGILSAHKTDSLCFQHILKIAFEEKDHYVDDTQNNDSTNDAFTNWIWTGADFCCPPNIKGFGNDMKMKNRDMGKENPKNLTKTDSQEEEKKESNNFVSQTVASVRMYLMEEEFMELQHLILNGTSYFSKSVSDLTLQLKLGKAPENRKSGLSLLQFIH